MRTYSADFSPLISPIKLPQYRKWIIRSSQILQNLALTLCGPLSLC